MMGMADVLKDHLKWNRYNLTSQGPTSPYKFGREGLYSLRSKRADTLMRKPPENQPVRRSQPQSAPQGLSRSQQGGDNNIMGNALSIFSATRGKPIDPGTIPGQQPGTPFSMGAVNNPPAPTGGLRMGGANPYLLATILGAAGEAIGGRETWQSRLGGNMARIGSQLYREQSEREYEEPERKLRMDISREKLKDLQETDMVEVSEVDPETGNTITKYVPKDQVPRSRITGLGIAQKDYRPTKVRELEFYESLNADQKSTWDKLNLKSGKSTKSTKQKEFEFRSTLNKGQRAEWDKLYGKDKAGSGESFAKKEQYKYLVGRLEELDKKLHGKWSEYLTDEERAKIQNDRKTILDAMVELDIAMSGGGVGPGMQRAQGTGKMAGQAMDKRSAIKMAVDAGVSKGEITNFLKQNPNVSVQDFLSHFKVPNAEAATQQQAAEEAPDVKNTPVSGGTLQRKGNIPAPTATEREKASQGVAALMRRKKTVPYNTSMTEGPTEEQQSAAKQELIDLSHKLGVGPGNWEALGRLAKDVGGWAWETYTNALNALTQGMVRGQEEARKQLPAYRG